MYIRKISLEVTTTTVHLAALIHFMLKDVQVITDTGTSFLGVPMAVLDGVIRMTAAKYDSTHQVYVDPCATMSTQPNLIFTVQGQKYFIPSMQYVLDLKFGKEM